MKENNLVNEPRLKGEPNILKINENNLIIIYEYEKRSNNYFDVIFNNNGKEIFIGRYVSDSNIKAMYKDGKILVFSSEDNNLNCITKVHSLYDILDDTYYSLTELECLDLFDSRINANNIRQKNKLTARTDCEKIHRMLRR